MKTVVSYSELRAHLKETLDSITETESELIVKRPKGKQNLIILPESLYNSIQETAYLLSTELNRTHLAASIQEAKLGKVVPIDITDIWK